MGFLKLEDSILHSTIWDMRPDREVFLVACLLSKPKKVKEEMAQLHVDRDEPTGWVVPPGEYGFAPVSGSGLVRATNLGDGQFQSGIEALKRLGEPEESSKSQEYDGRRVVRVNGGYIVLNLMKYRSLDWTSSVRSAMYRERKKKAKKKTKKSITRDEWKKKFDAMKSEAPENHGTPEYDEWKRKFERLLKERPHPLIGNWPDES